MVLHSFQTCIWRGVIISWSSVAYLSSWSYSNLQKLYEIAIFIVWSHPIKRCLWLNIAFSLVMLRRLHEWVFKSLMKGCVQLHLQFQGSSTCTQPLPGAQLTRVMCVLQLLRSQEESRYLLCWRERAVQASMRGLAGPNWYSHDVSRSKENTASSLESIFTLNHQHLSYKAWFWSSSPFIFSLYIVFSIFKLFA